jgi:hypothetical protein
MKHGLHLVIGLILFWSSLSIISFDGRNASQSLDLKSTARLRSDCRSFDRQRSVAEKR